MTDFTGSNTPAEHRDSWRTPPEILLRLMQSSFFNLMLQPAKKTDYVGFFISQEQNTLTTSWPEAMGYASGYVWLNPPYSNISPFVKKGSH
ncbi:DNA N-6-adenine-methyltransferase [Escherichia coli]|nr:DNA N-6-adenine-methyltransferase [Escherichia coli]